VVLRDLHRHRNHLYAMNTVKHIYISNVLVATVSIKKLKKPMKTEFGTSKLTHELFVNDTVVFRGRSLEDCQKHTHNFPWQLEFV